MISFRFMTLDDSKMVYDWRTSKEISKYMYTNGPRNFEEHLIWIKNTLDDRRKIYYIIVCEGIDVGVISFYNIDFAAKSGEWAFYIGNTQMQGRGIGAAAEVFAINTFFKVMQLDSLYCEVLETNEKVIAKHEKFGFKIIGEIKSLNAVRMLLKKEFHNENHSLL